MKKWPSWWKGSEGKVIFYRFRLFECGGAGDDALFCCEGGEGLSCQLPNMPRQATMENGMDKMDIWVRSGLVGCVCKKGVGCECCLGMEFESATLFLYR